MSLPVDMHWINISFKYYWGPWPRFPYPAIPRLPLNRVLDCAVAQRWETQNRVLYNNSDCRLCLPLPAMLDELLTWRIHWRRYYYQTCLLPGAPRCPCYRLVSRCLICFQDRRCYTKYEPSRLHSSTILECALLSSHFSCWLIIFCCHSQPLRNAPDPHHTNLFCSHHISLLPCTCDLCIIPAHPAVLLGLYFPHTRFVPSS